MLDCIVLAGGLGTRLQSVVSDRPKPLALVDNTPFLEILVESLEETGLVKKIVFAVGYRAETIIEFYRRHPRAHLYEFSREDRPLGTGGAVKQALEKTSTEHVLIVNGDSFLHFSLLDFFALHLKRECLATLAYTHVEDTARFGQLEFDNSGTRILKFKEKSGLPFPGPINAGVYLFRRNIFDRFCFPEAFSLEQDLFPQLIPLGFAAFSASGPFIDIGTPESYQQAPTFFQSTQTL